MIVQEQMGLEQRWGFVFTRMMHNISIYGLISNTNVLYIITSVDYLSEEGFATVTLYYGELRKIKSISNYKLYAKKYKIFEYPTKENEIISGIQICINLKTIEAMFEFFY